MQNDAIKTQKTQLPNGRATVQTPNPVQDIEYAIAISKLTPHKKQLLVEILTSIDMPDLRQQAFDNLFNEHTEKQDVSPFSIKTMLMDLLVLLTNKEVRKHISSWHLNDYPGNIKALFSFADTLDHDTFYTLRRIENLANFGEEKDSYTDHATVEYLHDLCSLVGFRYYQIRDEIFRALNPVSTVRDGIHTHPLNKKIAEQIECLNEPEVSENISALVYNLLKLNDDNRNIALRTLENLDQITSGAV